MKLTVITVSLNAAETIRETLDSVLAHREHIHEYLVVDGLSTDGTLDILRDYDSRFGGRLHYLSEKDTGLYDAMNKGIARATGDYILFLGADDLLLPGIETLISAEVSSGVDLVYGDIEVVEPDGSIRLERASAAPRMLGHVPKEMPVRHQGALFSTRAYRDLGGFDTSFRIAADYEFYLRFFQSGFKVLYLPATIARFDLGGVSSLMGLATAREYRIAQTMHGLPNRTAILSMWRSLLNLRIARVIRRIPALHRLLERRR